MKKILGLDLGTTSIGWAYVHEDEDYNNSSIIQLGVRVNPLTVDEQTNFEKGKPFSINKERTLKRGARRTLDRYQDRRKHLFEILLKAGIISSETILTEYGQNSTHNTWFLRSKAVTEKIELEEFARILFAINKKRGYKSSRKAKSEDEGQIIDGMDIAKKLYENNLTPGQFVFQLLMDGKKTIPDFYRSDLQSEFDKVWNYQKQFYPEILTNELYEALKGQGKENTRKRILAISKTYTAEIKDLDEDLKNEKTIKLTKRQQKKLQEYRWRNDAIINQISKEQTAYVLTEINNNINGTSKLLGAISDRSKELYFNKQTVGQYLYLQIKENRHTRLKNQVFYRQDYLDEFEKIWDVQSNYHSELTDELKAEIRDIIIFYQRKLKSQKGLISFCEFESREIELNGKKKTVGSRVAPKSSPLFQEFKIWQNLSNVLIRKKGSKKRVAKQDNQTSLFEEEKEIFVLDLETKQLLFDELNLKGNLKANKIIELLGYKPADWEMNYSELEGNRSNKALYESYLKILDIEGYDVKDLLKVKSNKDEVDLDDLNIPAVEIKNMVRDIFKVLEIDTDILDFDAELDGKDFEKQASYRLWHLLYSYEGDNSQSGNEKLYELLDTKFGFKLEHAKILANVTLADNYGNLSAKAMRKIYTFIKENNYSTACELAGYRHSKNSLTKEEIENRPLDDKLEFLEKNSLRNPVVEKILNQMVNVINTLIEKNRKENPDFRFDEIRVELARELKKNAKERAEMTTNINAAKSKHQDYVKILQKEFDIKNPTRKDIIKYKLYLELKNNGFKTLYSNTYITPNELFSHKFNEEHIIPKAKIFDDSFSNKTLELSDLNREKGAKTAFDFVESKYGSTEEYESRIKALYEANKQNKEEGISKAKYQKLLKRESEIGDGFIERDLRESQYIAKKAKEMLFQITRSVVSTSGSITDRLREDWDLVNIMKELNLFKYRNLGLTEMQERKFGQKVEVIMDWTKRNDHRHHAMDALTVAFTKRSFIQYLNNLNARRKDEYNEGISNSEDKKAIETSDLKISTRDVLGIEEKELYRDDEGKLRFNLPIPNFRQVAKEHLENIFISHKAKNKVVTKNINKAKNEVTSVVKDKDGKEKPIKGQVIKTPRGQLHKETVYGKYHYYEGKEEKISAKFDEKTISKVANPLYKKLLLERLVANDNDPKKAFSGKNALNKTPIYIKLADNIKVPETVKLVWLEEDYSQRVEVLSFTKDGNKKATKESAEKKIQKIIDKEVQKILLNRLRLFDNDPTKAFSDLEKNPIWLNEAKGISIKRVTISGVKNAEPLHYKKNHLGNDILDEKGNKIPADFVSTSNNHHVAVYRDEKGNLQERVVSLFESVIRVNLGLPVIFKEPQKIIDTILEKDITHKLILENLPEKDWQFLFTMKQNEMFVFPNEKTGFNPLEIDLLDPKNKKEISPNLFRVQKFSKLIYGNSAVREYVFRHHLETTIDDRKELKDITFKSIKSLPYFENIVKVRINHLGDIVSVGEY